MNNIHDDNQGLGDVHHDNDDDDQHDNNEYHHFSNNHNQQRRAPYEEQEPLIPGWHVQGHGLDRR